VDDCLPVFRAFKKGVQDALKDAMRRWFLANFVELTRLDINDRGLAERLGVDRTTVLGWRSGRQSIDMNAFAMIRAQFDALERDECFVGEFAQRPVTDFMLDGSVLRLAGYLHALKDVYPEVETTEPLDLELLLCLQACESSEAWYEAMAGDDPATLDDVAEVVLCQRDAHLASLPHWLVGQGQSRVRGADDLARLCANWGHAWTKTIGCLGESWGDSL
jgi:hypothetical protein